MNAATPEQNAAYTQGLCIDCRVKPYSAGRPRCQDCYKIWWARTVGEIRQSHRNIMVQSLVDQSDSVT
jgi:hypothetical protein